MKIFNWMTLPLVSLSLVFLSGCETDEQDQIARAQNCLDTATRDNADQCLSMVDGLESQAAYVIRCSARFLSKGVDATQMAQAYINRNKTDTQNNSVLGMMGVLAFDSREKADLAYADCEKTGVKSFVAFAAMGKSATILGSSPGSQILTKVANGETPTQADAEDALANYDETDTESNQAIGEAALNAKTQYCTAENATSKVCTVLNTAVGTRTDNADIGLALIEALRNR